MFRAFSVAIFRATCRTKFTLATVKQYLQEAEQILMTNTADNNVQDNNYKHAIREVKSKSFQTQIKAVPWLRRLVAGLSPRRPGFDPKSVQVGYVVDKVALGQVFLRVLQFSPVNFIPLVLHYLEKLKN
jgi:hypothetical protein